VGGLVVLSESTVSIIVGNVSVKEPNNWVLKNIVR